MTENPGITRRRLFGAVGAGAVIAGAGAVIGRATAPESDTTDGVVAFRGAHQPGWSLRRRTACISSRSMSPPTTVTR